VKLFFVARCVEIVRCGYTTRVAAGGKFAECSYPRSVLDLRRALLTVHTETQKFTLQMDGNQAFVCPCTMCFYRI
jgi:hypothetical protein